MPGGAQDVEPADPPPFRNLPRSSHTRSAPPRRSKRFSSAPSSTNIAKKQSCSTWEKQEEKKKNPMEFDSPLLTTIIEALAQLLRVAVWIASV